MPNHSQNWHVLKSLLTGYSRTHHRRENRTFDDHAGAKALALFLCRAKLATPTLDRATVDKVISGEEAWPRAGGLHHFDKIDLPSTFLEDFGLIAFYGNWCTVCPTQMPHADQIDSSLLPVVRALERLKDILYGRNDFVSPYYAVPVDTFKTAFSGAFGESALATLLPDLREEDGEFRLNAGTTHFDSLVSTYLWQELRKTAEIEEAFGRWMSCLRVYCSQAFPVEFDIQDWEERKQFNGLLLRQLAGDVSLSKDSNVLLRQLISTERNGTYFSFFGCPCS